MLEDIEAVVEQLVGRLDEVVEQLEGGGTPEEVVQDVDGVLEDADDMRDALDKLTGVYLEAFEGSEADTVGDAIMELLASFDEVVDELQGLSDALHDVMSALDGVKRTEDALEIATSNLRR